LVFPVVSFLLAFPEKSTSYEAHHYAVFSNLLSLNLSLVQIFSSAPCSQTPSNDFPQNLSEEPISKPTQLQIVQKFTAHDKTP
jgi:hypothetical protein